MDAIFQNKSVLKNQNHQSEKQIITEIDNLLQGMQAISQTKGVSKLLYLQNNYHQQLENETYLQDYYHLRDLTQVYQPTLKGLKSLVALMDADIGDVRQYHDSLLYIPARQAGLHQIKEIATFEQESQGNFKPLKAADLIAIIEQKEINNHRKREFEQQQMLNL